VCAGVLAAACQLITNTPYSHIGLAVYLPNKWTQEPELYIVELTKNFNRFVSLLSPLSSLSLSLSVFVCVCACVRRAARQTWHCVPEC
jgi:hypothetical protein